MKTLIYNCFSGISGDMNLGAMIDLGVDKSHLISELKKLNLSGWEIDVSKDQRHGITGTMVTVRQTVHEHVHRNLGTISEIIMNSNLSDDIKEKAIKIFKVIAIAEAHVHNMPVEDVHFHEVGAIDAIIDIVGAAICHYYLSPDRVILISPVELGGGFVKCAHGTLPVPAPATVEIIKGIPVSINGVDYESTTPTGAAILSVLADDYTLNTDSSFRITSTGYGVGHKEHAHVPNLLRVHMAESETGSSRGHEALMIECNIDDMNPEIYGHIQTVLFNNGASEVYLSNVIMKKGRPGIIISVICEKGNEQAIYDTLFTETTTIGLRTTIFNKRTLSRKSLTVETEYGEVTFKLSYSGEKLVSAKPEFEDCRKIALQNSIPVKDVITSLNRYIDKMY